MMKAHSFIRENFSTVAVNTEKNGECEYLVMRFGIYLT